MNFTRPQVYIKRKEDIKRLEDDFKKTGNDNLSEYFRELIMLGLDAKRREGSVPIANEIKKLRKNIDDINDSISFLKRCVYECYVLLERKEAGGNK